MDQVSKRWIRICLFNFLFLAFIGVVLRYKIAFYLPLINQKHLLHGHSHFAFSGWVNMALMVVLVNYLYRKNLVHIFPKYRWLLIGNLLTAYAMLITFVIEGYGPYSIAASTISIFISYAFAKQYWKDLTKIKTQSVSRQWFRLSLLFSVLSSFGAFALAYMMINRITDQNWYLASEYFYLHFQYNGWFFFACMGLLNNILEKAGVPEWQLKKTFHFFALAAIPSYLLSTLWMQLPVWLYLIVILAVIFQLAGWLTMIPKIRVLYKNRQQMPATARWLLLLSFIALSIKIFLQSGSVIPSMSTLAFGFRPIIIGYLHLVLLGVISLFILGYVFTEKLLLTNKIMMAGVYMFTAGIILNEIILMVQGTSAMFYVPVPNINEMLLSVTIIMFTGLLLMNAGARK